MSASDDWLVSAGTVVGAVLETVSVREVSTAEDEVPTSTLNVDSTEDDCSDVVATCSSRGSASYALQRREVESSRCSTIACSTKIALTDVRPGCSDFISKNYVLLMIIL